MSRDLWALRSSDCLRPACNSVPSGFPAASGALAPGHFRSYLPVVGSSHTASGGNSLPLVWGLGRSFPRASSSRPFSGALITELRGASSHSSLWILAASVSRGSH
ncbi:hypothetical protein NDU88_000236 [Pleurodeles waltl]|uniref:Uncharacterized protein n=1 Tax=Pleurodeles waltl TaxID=8319 RepID=A0AAV7UQ73_PLEWA|nr:hypothetical protein NDU88_000236 [Pleurodeles waltl]